MKKKLSYIIQVEYVYSTANTYSFHNSSKNASADSIKKPITNIEVKKHADLYCIKFIESISLGILWKTIVLTKIGISLLNKVDFVLKYIMERG
ncbi:hypothetical protein [Clostridium sp.]|uniref:hypothetical protein n=1 Tax=Clostridium sp. TaxID=1506 RepID=UPI002610C074|nr:hypothetical protein [Clostridium sp.]